MPRRSLAGLNVRLLLLVLLAMLPALALLLYNAAAERQRAAELVHAETQRVAHLTAANVGQIVEGQRQLLVALSRLEPITARDAAGCTAVLSSLVSQYPFYAGLAAAAPDGRLFCSTQPLTGTLSAGEQAWFQRAVETGGFALGDHQVDPLTGASVVVGAYPVFDDSGELRAVVAATLDLQWLDALLADAHLPAGAAVNLTDHNGVLLSRYPDPASWVGRTLEGPLRDSLQSAPGGSTELVGLDGVTRLYGFDAIETEGGPHLHVAVGIPTSTAFAGAQSALMRSLAAMVVATVVALAATRFLAEALVLRRARQLMGLSQRLAAGDLKARSGGPYGGSELDGLARAFDEMAAALEAREAELRRALRSLATLSACNQALVRAQDEPALLTDTCQNLVEVGGYRLAWIGLAAPAQPPAGAEARPHLRVAAQAAADPAAGDAYLASLDLTLAEAGPRRSPAVTAWHTGQPVTTVHRHAEARGAPWQAQALARGYHASMALPIVLDGQPIGVLSLYAGEANAFDDDAARLLDELASDVAFGLHTLRVRAARDQAEARLQTLNAQLEARVSERTAALQQSAAEFEELYDQAPCGYHSLDAAGRYLRVNQYELQLLGYARDEVVGRLSFADVLTPASAAAFRENFGRFQAAGQVHNVELELLRRDGAAIPVLLSADAVHDEAGRFAMSRAMLIDITDRKHAEAEIQALNAALAERAGELEAANRELHAFSYSVSHDLRAPLRSIDGFSLALVEDYGPALDDHARDYLSRIRASAQRMAELIDALLGLSRVTRAELRRVPLDLSALAAAVVAELRQREPERAVEVTLAPGLSAQGDPSLMRNVLENLLGNAWKFTAGCQPARIEFGSQPDDEASGGRVFFVRDNGAGFDMAYADRLFGAFQRLHDQREFPGTGVGLASVQRIIVRHGGRVWAEAAAGTGATFYFTLP